MSIGELHRLNRSSARFRRSICFLLGVLGPLIFQRSASANEEVCFEIPEAALKATYDTREGRSVLGVAVPTKYSGAKFSGLRIEYGDPDTERLTVYIHTERSAGHEERADIYLPEHHKLLRVLALYRKPKCYAELHAEFSDGRRQVHGK